MFRSSLVVVLTLMFAGPAVAQTTKPMDKGEVQHAQRLQTQAQQLDADAATASTTSEGQKRVTETIAKQFKVDSSVVTDLRNKKMGFGEISTALALSQELMKKDSNLSQQDALKSILDQRAKGMGWGQIANGMNLKLGRVVSEVHRADKRVERLAKLEKRDKMEKHDNDVDRVEKMDKGDKADRPDRMDRSGRPDRTDRVERVDRSGRH